MTSAKIMEGRTLSQKIKARIKEEVTILKESRKIEPHLVTILVGENAASRTYLRNKHLACAEAGIISHNIELPGSTSQRELELKIHSLNEDPLVTGILLQLPLPSGLDDASATAAVAPQKDVDGLHPCNLGLLSLKSAQLVPCTPRGVIALLRYYGVQIKGHYAVVVNRSKLVGRPLSQLLLNQDATVTVCHSKTKELGRVCREADILITAIGRRPEFIVSPDMIKPGAAVVDIGTSIIEGKVKGDVDFDQAARVAGAITPVPGGVGPMTIAMLLYNTVLGACLQENMDPPFKSDELGISGPS